MEKKGGNDAILKSDEGVDGAWRSRAGWGTDGSKGRCRGGCFNGIRFKTRDKNINAHDARQRSLGKVGCIHLEKFWQVNERRRWGIMNGWKRSGNSMACWGKRCFGYFCHLGMGFCASTADTRPVEHLFHMSVQTAAIPHGAASLILALIEKKKRGPIFLFFTPLCGGVKWMIRAAQKRKNGRFWDTLAQVIC